MACMFLIGITTAPRFFPSIYRESFVCPWRRSLSVLFFGWRQPSMFPFINGRIPGAPLLLLLSLLWFQLLFAMHRQTRLSFNLHGRRGDKNAQLFRSFRESPPCVFPTSASDKCRCIKADLYSRRTFTWFNSRTPSTFLPPPLLFFYVISACD